MNRRLVTALLFCGLLWLAFQLYLAAFGRG